jgi:hypothetical protein
MFNSTSLNLQIDLYFGQSRVEGSPALEESLK